ncbi:unnamed protein product [Closterium sp. NIES-64]|nr:unnamed protein product [Closterium sp. NIES-64]
MAPVNLGQLAGAGVMTTREHMQAIRNAGNRSDAATGDCSVVAGDDRPGAADDPCVIEHLPRGSRLLHRPLRRSHPTPWRCRALTCQGRGGRLSEAQVGDGRVEKEALAPAVGHIAVALHWDVVVIAAVYMHIALAVMRVAVAVLVAAGVDGLGQLLYSSTGVSRGRIFNARSHIPTAGLGIANAGSRIRPGSELGGHWRWQRCVWLGGQRIKQSRALDEGGVVAVAPQQHVVWKGTLRPNARPQHPLHRTHLPLLLVALLQQQTAKSGSLQPHARPQGSLLAAPLSMQLKQLLKRLRPLRHTTRQAKLLPRCIHEEGRVHRESAKLLPRSLHRQAERSRTGCILRCVGHHCVAGENSSIRTRNGIWDSSNFGGRSGSGERRYGEGSIGGSSSEDGSVGGGGRDPERWHVHVS